MRKLLLLTTLVVLMLPAAVAAQDSTELTDEQIEQQIEPVIKDVEGLRLQIVEQTQNPETKEIIFDVVVYSGIRSDRVQMRWDVEGAGELVTAVDQVSFRVDPGSVKSVKITVKPRARGVTNLSITVEAFEIEGRYLATVTQRIYSNSGGVRLPVTAAYKQLEIVSLIKSVATILLYIFGGVLLVSVGYGIFQKWLNRSENELEIPQNQAGGFAT